MRLFLAAVLLLLPVPRNAVAEVVACTQCGASQYSVTDLGIPGGGRFAQATAINARGDITVNSTSGLIPPNGFLLRDGAVIRLGVFNTAAYAVNGAGNVVGSSVGHAFLWDRRTGMVIDLGLGGSNGVGVALNESDQVVGSILRESGAKSASHAFLWEDGVTTDFGPLPGGTDGAASGINESRFVVGWSATKGSDIPHAVLWKRNGVIRDLGTLGGQTSYAYAINGRRQIVGGADTPAGDQHAFLWQNGVMMDLGTLGGSVSVAFGINGCGQVVGQSQTASGKFHAFVWENGVMTDIGKLHGDGESAASSINESGQIVGRGQAGPSEFHAVLWTPK